MTEKVNQLMITNLTQIAERVNLNLEIYTNTVYQIYQDEDIVENIIALMSDSTTGQAVAFNRIYNRLQQYYTTDQGVRCISIICQDGSAVIYDYDTGSSIEHLWSRYDDLREILPVQEADGQPGMVITPTMTFDERGEKKHYFHISKRVFDLDNLDQGSIATIVLSIDMQVLNHICNASQPENTGYGFNFAMTPENYVVIYPDAFFSGIHKNPDLSMIDFIQVTGQLKGKKVALNQYQDAVTGWTFFNAYDRDEILREVYRSQRLYVMIGIFAVTVTILLLLLLVKQIDKSVKDVVSGIKEVGEGNLEVTVPISQKDEIGEIARQFNKMTVKVKALLQEVRHAKDLQKNAEIHALEAQINPHFLYNTLDSINWMAIEHEEYEISKMLRNLGVILRYSVNKSNAIVTVAELTDWLDKYISLQQMRFQGVFTYSIHVPDEAKGKKIHKLLLQPFIENAIIHGLREMESGGLLNVDISLIENDRMLCIIIEDNGQGMPPEKVEQYNNMEQALLETGGSIGMQNSFARMRMYYGKDAIWKINSMENMGTVITLKLPAL